MLNKPIFSLQDFSGGLISADTSTLNLPINSSPDVLNCHTNVYKTIQKRLGFADKLNSVAYSGVPNGMQHYVQSGSVQYLMKYTGATLSKMDLVSGAWDGTWDTIAVDGTNGTQLSNDIMYFTTWSGDGTLIMTTESRNVPQRINATDTSYVNLHYGGAGTAPSGKYCFVWSNHTWVANTSADPDIVQRSTVNSYKSWNGTDSGSNSIVTGGDIGITGFAELNGLMYVFKKWSIHRFSYLGGSPLLDIKQTKSGIGTASQKSIVNVQLPQGEVLMFLGTDKHIYIFNGWQAMPITHNIYTPNNISPIWMLNINNTKLNKVHAKDFKDKNLALFFVPMNVFVDSSSSSKIVTGYGDAQIDTAQKKLGTASGLFDGTGDYLSLADHDDWNLGSGDWTVDFWVRFAATTTMPFLAQYTNANTEFRFDAVAASTKLRLIASNAGVEVANIYMTNNWSPSLNTWYHVAWVRNGSTVYLFIDGVSQTLTTTTAIGTLPDFTSSLTIGNDVNNGNVYFNSGWLDEFRISKGIARWTANFTPPTSAYTADTYTKLLLHCDGADSGSMATHCIAYDYINKSFWPWDNMNFGDSCVADDGSGQRKIYVLADSYSYLFYNGNDDDGTAINAYWTSKRFDVKNIAQAKQLYHTEVITNNAAYGLAFQQRKNWETSWSDSVTLIQNQEKQVLKTERIANLIQYKFTDNSSSPISEISRIDLTEEVIGVGK